MGDCRPGIDHSPSPGDNLVVNIYLRIAIVLALWVLAYHFGVAIQDTAPVIGEY